MKETGSDAGEGILLEPSSTQTHRVELCPHPAGLTLNAPMEEFTTATWNRLWGQEHGVTALQHPSNLSSHSSKTPITASTNH